MNYDYNANLLFEDRVALITNEIIKAYPEIDKDIAMKIAAIEEPISTDNIIDCKYKRLYNILRFNINNEKIKNKVIYDMLEYYKEVKGKNEKVDKFIDDLLIYIKYHTSLPEYK